MTETSWNFDMSAAPKGSFKTTIRKGKDGKEFEIETFVPAHLILCANDENQTVTKSRWMPKERRWNMFATSEAPLAWMLYPTHPLAEIEPESEKENS